MKRHKHDRIKKEKPETSSSFAKASQEHDLAYYIHDRVELMHQVFSVLKLKDIKAMAPECVRKLPVDDLQELCTEELLGISSKRLCAILDGAEPPSDTESSSQSPTPELETISLDSISSDEEILSQGSSKRKKHKHHRRGSKSKSKRKKSKSVSEEADQSKASRAGLTVLELLELQARARAIRAQLQQEQAKKPATEQTASTADDSSDDDVEIKEERPEVVEISSDEEKPNAQELEKALKQTENTKQGTTRTETDKITNKKDKKKKDKSKEKEKNKEKDKSKPIQTNKGDNKNTAPAVVAIADDVSEKDKEKDSEKDSHTVTRRINDLIITVPQQHSKKIKLNRSKPTASLKVENITNKPTDKATVNSKETDINVRKVVVVTDTKAPEKAQPANKEKRKDKKNKTKKQKKKDKKEEKDSDHDEITLQLSDSEKMDLLEDFDRKNYDCVSSSSEDSESSSETSENSSDSESDKDVKQNNSNIEETVTSDKNETVKSTAKDETVIETEEKSTEAVVNSSNEESQAVSVDDKIQNKVHSTELTMCASTDMIDNRNDERNVINDAKTSNERNSNEIDILEVESNKPIEDSTENLAKEKECETGESNKPTENTPDKNVESMTVVAQLNSDNSYVHLDENASNGLTTNKEETTNSTDVKTVPEHNVNVTKIQNDDGEENCETSSKVNKELSEGELSDNPSSEIEAVDVQPEVVCISDEESKTEKKKKKKDKKNKKEKKSKKDKSDFRSSGDQNFYRIEKENTENSINMEIDTQTQIISLDEQNDEKKFLGDNEKETTYDDDVYEILELSDDSSCYEVEGTVLSKEPTAEEIEALSAKIDEIEREEVVTQEQIREHEKKIKESKKDSEETTSKSYTDENDEEIENISWKDRYLGSKKVKRVLTTSNIMNALRKKNKELKQKLEESKKREAEEKRKIEEESKQINVEPPTKEFEEGSIEQYNTLQASTKYVDPVPDPAEKPKETQHSEINPADSQNLESTDDSSQKNIDIEVSGEMKKDAKLLLKIYKKLLKYNDITKVKDPNKKKKKGKKKKEKANVDTKSV